MRKVFICSGVLLLILVMSWRFSCKYCKKLSSRLL